MAETYPVTMDEIYDNHPVGRRRTTPVLSSHVPIRFGPEMIEQVKKFAIEDGCTVSSWIRNVVRKEVARRNG